MDTTPDGVERTSWAGAAVAVTAFMTSIFLAPFVRDDVVDLARHLAQLDRDSGWIVAGWMISWAPALYVSTLVLAGLGGTLLRLEWAVVHAPVLMVLSAAMFAVVVPAVDPGSRPSDTREDHARWYPDVPDAFYEAASSFLVVAMPLGVLTILAGAVFWSADRLSSIGRRVTPVTGGCAGWGLALASLILMLLV